ncbi:MAG: glutamate 5-kinase, partial [Acinetobacter sp.]
MKNKIQSKVAKAFDKKLADAVDTFTCSKEIQSGEFDFESQTYPVITVEGYQGRGVLFGSYLKDMVKPADYQTTDSKAIVLQNEVTGIPQIG